MTRFLNKNICCILIYFLLPHFVRSQNQNKVDSLERILKIANEDTVIINVLNSLAWELSGGNPNQSIKYSQMALNIANKIDDKKLIANSYHQIAWANYIQGRFNDALQNNLIALKLRQELENKIAIGSSLGNIALIYWKKGNSSSSLNYYFQALKIFEEANNNYMIAISLGNIGLVYWKQLNYSSALDYYSKALKIAEQTSNKTLQANILGNIGIIHKEKNDLSNSIRYYDRALKLNEEIGNKHGMASNLTNIGNIYNEEGKYSEALEKYFSSLKLREEIDDRDGIVNTNINLGLIFIKLKNIDEANRFLNNALLLAEEIGNIDEIKDSYAGLSKLDSSIGNWKFAFNHYKLYSQYKDSIFNQESSRQINEMQTIYETEKKEKEIELQKVQLEKKDTENKKQQYVIWSVASGFLLMVFFSGLIFRKNKEIAKRKKEVEKAKEKIEEHQKEIIDSITYARRLQHAILPPTELIKKYFPNSFVLYNPKDIVAGDFYWMEIMDNIIFIAAADCTGHGVPGAMVSVVCSNALNRTVKEFGLRDTGKILDKVTDLVLETFEKSASEVKDGMDISLLAYNLSSKQIQWSGANNPLWYIQNGQVVEIKADKQPVGKFDKRKSFTSHSIEHSDYSVFYLFTDGLPDQFGGPKGKKFMYKRFENNLSDISKLPMDEQQAVLEKTFQDWKGSLEQVDDVTVIGIKI